MRPIEEEAVPPVDKESSKEDSLVDDSRLSKEALLPEGTASQEENGNTKRRPRSVVNVDFFIDAILLLIGFFPNNMGNSKKGKHYVKNLLFIFKKPLKTRKNTCKNALFFIKAKRKRRCRGRREVSLLLPTIQRGTLPLEQVTSVAGMSSFHPLPFWMAFHSSTVPK